MRGVEGEQGRVWREKLARSHLLLVFTPGLIVARDPFALLGELLPWVDVVQVRPKAPAPSGPSEVASARESYELCVRALELAREIRAEALITVDDRVDVARALLPKGLAGVHVGQTDCPPDLARRLLGPLPLIGLSTHSMAQVAQAQELPVDYLGFGPVFASATKGYDRGQGAERAWIAAQASSLPVFPIGGIELVNAGELARIGRAAVASALLQAQDPARGARELLALLDSARVASDDP